MNVLEAITKFLLNEMSMANFRPWKKQAFAQEQPATKPTQLQQGSYSSKTAELWIIEKDHLCIY